MKEFKIAAGNATRMFDFEKEINKLAKEGFEICSPISSVFHPFERKENEHSWVEYNAWTELMVVMSREFVQEKKEKSMTTDPNEHIGPDIMWRSNMDDKFKPEFKPEIVIETIHRKFQSEF